VRSYTLDVDALDADSQALWQAVRSATETWAPAGGVDAVLTALEQLVHPINTFFDRAMVMAEDMSVRRNRLALVYRIAALPDGRVDLSQVMGF
jgi:glycyl-tRNA synthetase